MSLQRLGRTFATDATFGDLGRELLQQGSNYATRRLIKMADKGGKKAIKKMKDKLTGKKSKPARVSSKEMKKKEEKTFTTYTDIVNSQAGRASMKKSGKIKSVRRGKTVKVSSRLRKQVKEVMKEAAYSGNYNAVVQGTIGTAIFNAGIETEATGNTAAGVFPSANGVQVIAIPRYNNSKSANWNYWGALYNGSIESPPSYQNTMEHFSPLQFLDAASKLWNCKYGTAASWYAHDSGNIQLNVNRATGIGQDPTASNAPAMVGDLKLQIVNSYVQYTLRNTTQRSMTVEIFHCTPKLKFPGSNALTDLCNSVRAELSGVDTFGATATAPRIAMFQTQASTAGSAGSVMDVIQNIQFDPKDSRQFKSRWNYQKVTIRIGGGEVCQHSVQGPKNVMLDYAKIVQQIQGANAFTATKTIPVWVKGYSVSVFMRVIPDQVPVFYSASVIPANINQSGNFDLGRNSDLIGKKITLPIAVDMKYGYHLKCPEQAGYLQQAVVAGAAQYLNLKRVSRRFDNYTSDPIFPSAAVSPTNYLVNNEENPGLSQAGAIGS